MSIDAYSMAYGIEQHRAGGGRSNTERHRAGAGAAGGAEQAHSEAQRGTAAQRGGRQGWQGTGGAAWSDTRETSPYLKI